METGEPQGGLEVQPSGWNDLRRWAFALSLANLCYLRSWMELLTFTPANTFYMKEAPKPPQYFGLMLAVGLTALVVGSFGGWVHSRRSKTRAWVWRGLILALLLIVANQLRLVASTMAPALYPWLRQPVLSRIGWSGVAMVLAVGGIVANWLVWKHAKVVSGFGARLLFLLWPLAPLFFVQGIYCCLRPLELNAALTDGTKNGAGAAQARAGRVVWVIFDEWDYRLTFEAKRGGPGLPHLEKLKAEAMFARGIRGLANDTRECVPSMLAGRVLKDLQPQDEASATVLDAIAQRTVPLKSLETVFGRLTKAGYRTAVVGWYLPYCRLWGNSIQDCQWWQTDSERSAQQGEVWQVLTNQLRQRVETGVLSPFGISSAAENAGKTLDQMLGSLDGKLADGRIDLVYAHLPLPHPPFFYDPDTGARNKGNRYEGGYWDHLVLLDETVGRIRSRLERAGLWDSTALVLTSDHHYRNSRALDGVGDERVPLLVRLPGVGKAAGVTVDQRKTNLLVGALVEKLVKTELKTPKDVADWIEREEQPKAGGDWGGRWAH